MFGEENNKFKKKIFICKFIKNVRFLIIIFLVIVFNNYFFSYSVYIDEFV